MSFFKDPKNKKEKLKELKVKKIIFFVEKVSHVKKGRL